MSGYGEAGASLVRRALKAFLPNSGAPNEDIDWNNYTLRQRGRLLYMASPVATAAVNTNRTKVVGTGLTLKSSVDRETLGVSPEAARDWQRKTEAEFRLWASKRENCDALGMNNFEELQQLAIKSWLMSGDVFALIKRHDASPVNPYTLRLHVVEADRVSTPAKYGARAFGRTDGEAANGNRIFDGVEVDGSGAVVAYHVCSAYPNQFAGRPADWQRVEARGRSTGLPNVLHIMDSERPEQYRGVTYLAQVIEPLLQLRRYTESELMAALVQSFFSAWVKTASDTGEMPFNEVGAGDIDDGEGEDESGRNVLDGSPKTDNEYAMGPGTVAHLAEGEDIAFGNPNIPTAGFEAFTRTICRLVGAALELPYDVLIKEFGASYSASRGALLEAWEAFKMRRKWFVDDFCQPAYEIWLSEAVALGRIKAPGFFGDPLIRAAWCGARWIGPVQGQLDPKKEVAAAIESVAHGFKTHEQVTRELGGGDWAGNVEQLKDENSRLRAARGEDVL
jgi:lambda family phage portal protein